MAEIGTSAVEPAVTPVDTVVDVNKLHLPAAVYDAIADGFNIRNGSIVRYLPGMTYHFLSATDQELLHQAMTKKVGVVFPDVLCRGVDDPEGYYNYSLLLEFSW